jgi:SAM-dependent methyltransferase
MGAALSAWISIVARLKGSPLIRCSVGAPGSVPSRATSERPGPVPDGGVPVYPLTPRGRGPDRGVSACYARPRLRAAALPGMTNVDFWRAKIERVPLRVCSVDLVISNGLLNLCPEKPRVLGEVYRFLEPGGRFQMADILLEPQSRRRRRRARGPCPTESPEPCGSRSLPEMLARAGFAEARVHRWTGYRTPTCTQWRWRPRPGQVPGRPFKSAVERHQGLECPRRRANRVE